MLERHTYCFPPTFSGRLHLPGTLFLALILMFGLPDMASAQKKEKAKSNKKELRQLRYKTKSKQGEKAHKGDITGRRLSTKKPRLGSRAKYAQPNPYAGRKSMSDKQRMKYLRSSPRFSNRNTENAGRGNVYSNKSKRITFTGKSAYRHNVIRSASRSSERNVKTRRIVPRTSSGAYVSRKRKRPYAWKTRTPWEEAYKGDITGRKVRVKRTSGRPSIQAAPRLSNRNYTRRGDKAYSGRGKSGYLSVSGKRKERAYRGQAKGGYLSATKPSERAWKGDIAGFKLSTMRSKPPRWGKVDGQEYYNKGPQGERPYSGKIKGRQFMSVRRKPETAGKPRMRGRLTINVGKAPSNFRGNMRGRKPLKGGGSVVRGNWNNGGQPLEGRRIQSQTLKVSGFSGNMRSKGKPYKGRRNFSVGFKMHNNDGKPVQSLGHGKQDIQIAGFSGQQRGNRKKPKLAGSVSVLPWNNKGEPLQRKMIPAESRKAMIHTGSFKRSFKYVKNDRAHEDAMKKREPGKNYYQAGKYSGAQKRNFRYEKNPSAADGSLKVRGASRAILQATSFQGNIKMSKRRIKNRHPSYKFEDDRPENKNGFNFKLFWSKLFKKQENQPEHLKEKIREPRFDKGEKGLWND